MERNNHEQAISCLKALAHPIRLQIISLLKDGERKVTDFVTILGCSQSNISQHLSVMRYKGLVKDRRVGNEVYYSLTSDKTIALVDMLMQMFCKPENNLE